jgi:putative metallohydrolase (TIGR04338 family)
MEKPKDSQRKKVLSSIEQLQTSLSSEQNASLEGYKNVKEYVYKIVKSKWFQRNWTVENLELKNGEPSVVKSGTTLTVSVPEQGSVSEAWVLKLFAHALSEKEDEPAHGREFCRTYLSLVQHFLGKEASENLSAAYKQFGVKTRFKRVMSAEQIKALKERMMKLRPWEKAHKKAEAVASA